MFNPDSIIPTFITSAMPWWFRVVFLLTLLSAAMSTMSSQYHTLGTAIGRDVVEQIIGPSPPGANRTHPYCADRDYHRHHHGGVIWLQRTRGLRHRPGDRDLLRLVCVDIPSGVCRRTVLPSE